MMVSNINEIFFLFISLLLSYLFFQVNLSIIKALQIFLLLLVSYECFLFLSFLLVGIIQSHHIPHCNFCVFHWTSNGLPTSCSAKVIFCCGMDSTTNGRIGLWSHIILWSVTYNAPTFEISILHLHHTSWILRMFSRRFIRKLHVIILCNTVFRSKVW